MKKGYTLVEVLAVLVLLTTIIGLVAINAIYYQNKRKQKDYNNIKSIIIENAKVLVNTDKKVSKAVDSNIQISNECKLKYNDLVSHGLMDKNTINPITGNEITDSYVLITLDTTNYEYSYKYVDKEEEMDENLTDCLEGLSN